MSLRSVDLSTRYGPVALTSSALGSSRSTSIAWAWLRTFPAFKLRRCTLN
jgi:hypothetical protein